MWPGSFSPTPNSYRNTVFQATRLWVRTKSVADQTTGAYDWQQQVQANAANGTFIDDPNGSSGTRTSVPLYMADGSKLVAVGRLCEAIFHPNGYLLGVPVNGNGPAPLLSGSGVFDLGLTTYGWYRYACINGVLNEYRRDAVFAGTELSAVSPEYWSSIQGCCGCSGSGPDSVPSTVVCACCPNGASAAFCVQFPGTTSYTGVCPSCSRLQSWVKLTNTGGGCTWSNSPLASCPDGTFLGVNLFCLGTQWFLAVQTSSNTGGGAVMVIYQGPKKGDWDCKSSALFGSPHFDEQTICQNFPNVVTVSPAPCPSSPIDGPCCSGMGSNIQLTVNNVSGCACVAGTYNLVWDGSGFSTTVLVCGVSASFRVICTGGSVVMQLGVGNTVSTGYSCGPFTATFGAFGVNLGSCAGSVTATLVEGP